MTLIQQIRDAINDHVTYVSDLHRLKFIGAHAGVIDTDHALFVCVCGFGGDRSSWNDHIDEMYRVAAIAPEKGG